MCAVCAMYVVYAVCVLCALEDGRRRVSVLECPSLLEALHCLVPTR